VKYHVGAFMVLRFLVRSAVYEPGGTLRHVPGSAPLDLFSIFRLLLPDVGFPVF